MYRDGTWMGSLAYGMEVPYILKETIILGK